MPPIERIGQSRRETENHLQVSAIAFKLETEKSSSLFAGRVGKFVQKNIFQLKWCLWLTFHQHSELEKRKDKWTQLIAGGTNSRKVDTGFQETLFLVCDLLVKEKYIIFFKTQVDSFPFDEANPWKGLRVRNWRHFFKIKTTPFHIGSKERHINLAGPATIY